MCCRFENFVLRKYDYDGLSKFIWKEIFVEIEKNCFIIMYFLVILVNGNLDYIEEKKVFLICFMYVIFMFLRVLELFRL